MIYRLRRKLIWISGLSVVGVFLLIFAAICAVGAHRLNQAMDLLTDRIAANGGAFPQVDEQHPLPEGALPDFITEETSFSVRFFTVRFDPSGEAVSEDVASVASVAPETARAYGEQAVRRGAERGWIDGYRYRIYDTGEGTAVVFVDGKMNCAVFRMTLFTAGAVLLCSLLAILLLIFLLSRRAVRPVAESYERQKQFVTDAGHELKTPLTLILADLDILETEVGKREWLEDIRSEGERMRALVEELVTLSRMDEEGAEFPRAPFSLSDAVADTVSEFQPLGAARGVPVLASIAPGVQYCGDEGAIRRVVAILLDNGVKYCDAGGSVRLKLTCRRHPTLWVENDCAEVEHLELDRLFDRFYRSDRARTSPGGFGIGLSIAKAIVQRHRGEVRACRGEGGRIVFRVVLR